MQQKKPRQDLLERYRAELLSSGLQEAALSPFHFYRPATELTAFVVNLKGSEYGITITYGYASTAFIRMKGSEDSLLRFGVSSEDVTLRQMYLLCDEAEESIARQQIQELYLRCQHTPKEELLALAKEKRKAFLGQIATALKPMGFRKKGNTWRRDLTQELYLMLNLQKSAFSDTYYYNVYIGKNGTLHYGDCYYDRVAPQGMCPMDWQALSPEEFARFLEGTLLPALREILDTPLEALGRRPHIQKSCSCQRNLCPNCWVEKNLWGT